MLAWGWNAGGSRLSCSTLERQVSAKSGPVVDSRGSGTFGCRNRGMFLNNDDDGSVDEFIQKWCQGVPPLCGAVPLRLFTLIRDYEILKEAR